MDKMEPADPTDRIDPEEPIDKMDPLEPMLRIDPVEPASRRELFLLRMGSFSQPAPKPASTGRFCTAAGVTEARSLPAPRSPGHDQGGERDALRRLPLSDSRAASQ
jgi:hypothetical protein